MPIILCFLPRLSESRGQLVYEIPRLAVRNAFSEAHRLRLEMIEWKEVGCMWVVSGLS